MCVFVRARVCKSFLQRGLTLLYMVNYFSVFVHFSLAAAAAVAAAAEKVDVISPVRWTTLMPPNSPTKHETTGTAPSPRVSRCSLEEFVAASWPTKAGSLKAALVALNIKGARWWWWCCCWWSFALVDTDSFKLGYETGTPIAPGWIWLVVWSSVKQSVSPISLDNSFVPL